MFINEYNNKYIMVKVPKNMYFEREDVERWEAFCEHNFKTKKVLSKVMSESMEQYIENFEIKN